MQIIPEHPILRDVADYLAMAKNDAQISELDSAVEIRRADYQVVLRDGTAGVVVGWDVWWFGVRHGGRALDYIDAVYHADRLRKAPDWDRDAWRARHRAGAVA